MENTQPLQKIIQLKGIIDALPDPICLIDKDLNLVHGNKALLKLLSLEEDDVIGQKCFHIIHNLHEPPEHCPIEEVFKRKKTVKTETFDERLNGHNQLFFYPYMDQDQNVIGVVHVIKNINKRKILEKTNEDLTEQVLQAKKFEEVGRLAAGIAHEINTPTQFIGTNIEFLDDSINDLFHLIDGFLDLLKKIKSNPEFQKALENNISEIEERLEEADYDYLKEEVPLALTQSKEGVDRVTNIVRAMKEFSHPSPKEKLPVDLNKLIETTASISKNEWKYVADLELDLQEDLPLVTCQKDKIGQALLNLIINAAHSIGEKKEKTGQQEKGKITVSSKRDGDFVEIKIADTGTGIPEKYWEKIFEPFFTTKAVGKGTGQGLAFTREIIVEKHKGTLDFDTEVGKGTTFIIRLPIGPK